MIDGQLVLEIRRLTEQRQLLRESHTGAPLSAKKLEQLRQTDAALDDCWARLRQRRAWRQVGLGPDGPSGPPPSLIRAGRGR